MKKLFLVAAIFALPALQAGAEEELIYEVTKIYQWRDDRFQEIHQKFEKAMAELESNQHKHHLHVEAKEHQVRESVERDLEGKMEALEMKFEKAMEKLERKREKLERSFEAAHRKLAGEAERRMREVEADMEQERRSMEEKYPRMRQELHERMDKDRQKAMADFQAKLHQLHRPKKPAVKTKAQPGVRAMRITTAAQEEDGVEVLEQELKQLDSRRKRLIDAIEKHGAEKSSSRRKAAERR